MNMIDVSQQLRRIHGGGAFAVTRSLPAKALDLTVKDVGQVSLPLTTASAENLRKVARPARYGLRERTVLDLSVRDAWEVAKSRIQIDQRSWQAALAPELEQIHSELGLPIGTRLKAELHNLLIYGPGQFFAPHQDSEKSDAMIASLVVTLPSQFRGGALEVEHRGEKLVSRGSVRQLILTAFFADCFHSVKRVTDGFRVSLTYHLLLEGVADVVSTPKPNRALTEAVRSFFATPVTKSWRKEPDPPPERLVYLLDHQYTQASLRWEALKQDDALRAAALEQTAALLDCEIFLALADVHETWDCMDEFGPGPRRRRRGWDDDWDDDLDDQDSGANASSVSLTDLIDSNVELRHWVAPPGGAKAPRVASRVAEEELCWTRASKDCEPFESEYEPYQGNWGNTVERWYHRAAVVLWPRQLNFLLRAKQDPNWALAELLRMAKRDEGSSAREHLQQLHPFWQRHRLGGEPGALLPRVFELAAGLDDAELVASLLEPFTADDLRPATVGPWLAAVSVHGHAVGEGWLQRSRVGLRDSYGFEWLRALPELCATFVEQQSPAGRELATSLCRAQWQRFETRIAGVVRRTPRLRMLEALEGMDAWWLSLLGSSVLLDDRALSAEILTALQDPTRTGDLRHPVSVLRLAVETVPTLLPWLRPVRDHLLAGVQERLTEAPRAAGNWSIDADFNCDCALCGKLRTFLLASTQRQLAWPLAKDGRQHIHQMLDHHAMPLRHTTRRQGRPYTLLLEKTQLLFDLERAEREALETAGAWLEALGP